MKKQQILILATIGTLIIFNSGNLTAQTQKGSTLFEGGIGNLNYMNNKSQTGSGLNIYNSEDRIFFASLYPRIGYFINSNMVVGISLNINYRASKYTSYSPSGSMSDHGTYKVLNAGVSPFFRYYFTKNSKNRFYAQIGGGVNLDVFQDQEGTTYFDNGNEIVKYKGSSEGKGISGEAMIGFNHFFTESIALNTSVGYSYTKRTQTSSFTTTSGNIISVTPEGTNTSLNGNAYWNIGFTIIIPNKKENK